MMTRYLVRFFAISPGEEKKTILLFAFHFFFFLGQSWGALAALTLFLDNWPAEDLAFMFIGSAVIMFAVGLAYSSFADRISNLRLLVVIFAFIGLWLLSVRLLFVTNGGPGGLAYPYFYLLYDLVRDLSVVHLITYTNGFYNTRSAKHAMPFILSAGLAANTVAGFTVAVLGRRLGLENLPLLWLATLIVAGGLVLLLERRYGAGARSSSGVALATPQVASSWDNVRAGLLYVRGSALLRWLALSAFAMVLLMNVVTFQSSQIFQTHYAGNPEAMLRFFGFFAGFSNLAGVLIQSLLIGRLVSAVGVGTASLIFPFVTTGTVLLLGLMPTYITAVLGRMTHLTFRRAVQAPIDAILYNCLPPAMKGRARAFIHTLVIPVGALAGGLLLLCLRQGWISPQALAVSAAAVAVLYVVAMLRVRIAYSSAFSQLLADGELAFLRSGQQAFQHPDPQAIAALNGRLQAAESPEMTLFLCEMLYELQGSAALPQLRTIAERGDPVVQAELIRLLGETHLSHPTVRAMALSGLQSDEPQVCVAAASVFAAMPGVEDDRAVLAAFAQMAQMPHDDVRAAVLPTLLRHGRGADLDAANVAVAEWLHNNGSGRSRMLAMDVLAQAGDETLLQRLEPYVSDADPGARLQAARLMGGLAARATGLLRDDAVARLTGFFQDPDESVQLAAVHQFGGLPYDARGRWLWPLLHEDRDLLRRAAAEAFLQPNPAGAAMARAAMPPALHDALMAALTVDDLLLAESAAYIQAMRLGGGQMDAHVLAAVARRAADLETVHAQYMALAAYHTPAGSLLQSALHDLAQQIVDQIFWLLGALGSVNDVQTLRRALHSVNDATRANAAEALESLTTPSLTRTLLPFCASSAWTVDDSPAHGSSALSALQVVRMIWPELSWGRRPPALSSTLAGYCRTAWIKAIAIHAALGEHRLVLTGEAAFPSSQGVPDRALSTAVRATSTAGATVLVETCAWALTQLGATQPGADEPSPAVAPHKEPAAAEPRCQEHAMLTLIEKVLFLKEVSLFADMAIDQLRVVAAISEELEYDDAAMIVSQGGDASALYVVVQGKVAVQTAVSTGHRTSIKRLATLGPREYFGEMAIFDSQPFGSDVIAMEPVRLLQVRQEPLLSLLELHPDLSFSLLKVFSLRLRHFMKLAEERTKSRPKQLMDLYDTFDG